MKWWIQGPSLHALNNKREDQIKQERKIAENWIKNKRISMNKTVWLNKIKQVRNSATSPRQQSQKLDA